MFIFLVLFVYPPYPFLHPFLILYSGILIGINLLFQLILTHFLYLGAMNQLHLVPRLVGLQGCPSTY